MKSMIFRIVLCAAATTFGISASAAQDGDASGGGNLLSRHCAMCHAIGRFDTSPNSKAPPLRNLAERQEIELLAKSLREGLLSGHPEMPKFVLPPNDIAAVIRYLLSIQTH